LGRSDKVAVATRSFIVKTTSFRLHLSHKSQHTLGAEFKRAASYTGESTIDFLPPSVATVQLTDFLKQAMPILSPIGVNRHKHGMFRDGEGRVNE